MRQSRPLTAAGLKQWHDLGFVQLGGLLAADEVQQLQQAALQMLGRVEKGDTISPAFVVEEAALARSGLRLSEHVSKIFRVHREQPVFQAMAVHPRILAVVSALLGEQVDCFLSQFIFKLPNALGQPWHQDGYYFPFSGPAQVGVWIAVTEARLDNGPLWVLPGSHRQPIHEVVPDPRTHANAAYVEIVDMDFSAAQPVLMQPGDVLFFHSHLMHRSTDNGSADLRAAMVYHYADATTEDHSVARLGRNMPNIDWMPVLREQV